MAKRSNKTGATAGHPGEFPPGTDVARQMNDFINSMETYTKHKIECWVCMEASTARDTTEARFARELYAEGWRVVTSKMYQTTGAACPKCVRTNAAEKDGRDD